MTHSHLRALIREAAALRHRRVTRRFRNEIGNSITVAVEETEDTGTRADSGEDATFDAVRIVIEGPTSVSENTITRKEAEVLLSSLLRVLRPAPEGR
jgi:hypothetical protein